MSCLALAPPRRPKELENSWAYGHALPRAKTPTIFVPTQPVLSANAWEYNQISLSWVQPLIGAQPGDYYEVQISTDGGTTWEEFFRIIPYTDIQTGAIQTGADFAGFDPGTTYHFRVRPFMRTVPQFTFKDWTNVASATTPNYVQSGQTSTGATVRVVNNRAQWNLLNGVVRLGDIIELSLSAEDLSTLVLWRALEGPGKWVTVRSQGYDTSGMKFDKRVTSNDLAKMATIWVDGTVHGNVQALGGATSAKYYTIEGVHVQCRKSGGGTAFPWANAAVDFGPSGIGSNSTTSLELMKSHIELHRCYIDKTTDTTPSFEGVMFNSLLFGVIKDSVIIGGSLSGPEPRGLAASTSENCMADNCSIAGASICFFLDRPCALIDGRTNNRNWRVKRCWFNRRQAWKDTPSTYVMKNLIEIKRGTDVDYYACVGEFSRMGSNQPNSMLFTPRGTDQSGTVYGNFRVDYSIFRDITRGFMINNDFTTGVKACRDLVIENSLVDEISGPSPSAPSSVDTWFSETICDQNKDRVVNIYHRHCTFIDRNAANQSASDSCISHIEASSNNPQLIAENWVFEHCMAEFLDEGISGAPTGSNHTGTAVLNGFATTYSVTGNVFGGDSALNSASNYTDTDANRKAAGNAHESTATFRANFESYTTGDYRLKATSPHKGAAPGGKDRGADIATLMAKTLHCVDGNWTEVLPTDIDDLEEWADAGYQMFKDAGVTIAADGDTVQQGIGRSSLALVSSNATASQRPILKAATLAVPSLEYNAANDTALLYPVDTLDLRTDDATWFHVFQYPSETLATPQQMAGNLPTGAGNKGYVLGVALGKLHQTFIYDGTNYVGLDQGTIEVMWGDVVIIAIRWDNSTGTMEKYVQRSDSDVLLLDVTHPIPAIAGADINSVEALARGRNDGQFLDCSFREQHFLMYRRKLSDFELQTVANYLRGRTDLAPKHWTITREPTNPITYRPTGEPREQYNPAPIILPDNSRWFYCKGGTDLYLWKSANFSTPQFALQNNGAAVLLNGGPGSNDELHAVEPYAQLEESASTVHIYYKGFNASMVPSSMYATAPMSNPASTTKQGTVLTAAAFGTAFGGESVNDFHVTSRLKIGGTWNVFGARNATTGTKQGWRLWRGTDTGFGTTITPVAILDWPRGTGVGAPNVLIHTPAICKNPNGPGYFMIVTQGKIILDDGDWNLYCFYSDAGNDDDWQTVGPILIHQTFGWEKSRVYAAKLLMQGSGNFDLPAVVNGHWELFYSGSNFVDAPAPNNTEDLTGLLYMTPR